MKKKPKAFKPPTKEQAELLRQLDLPSDSVTFKTQSAALPCPITITFHGGNKPVEYWICAVRGKLQLNDKKPDYGKPTETDEQEHAAATTDFDEASIYAADEKVDVDAVSHGLTRGEAEAWLKDRGLSEEQRAVVLAQHFERKSTRAIAAEIRKCKSWVAGTLKGAMVRECLKQLQRGIPLPEPSAPTAPSDAARTAAADAVNRWTLPEAMIRAHQKVDNYLPSYANDHGVGALGLEKLFSSENRQLTEEQMEQLEKMSPQDRLALSLPPGRSVAEAITASIRLNPRSLLNRNSRERLVAALVDLLEAAHFGNFEHRIPWLLPKDNHKLAAETARKALDVLVSGNQGNPREYPTHLLAGVVGIMQVALAPLQRTWRKMIENDVPRAARLKAIRERFRAEAEELGRVYCPTQPQEPTRALMVEVENLMDSELQSRLTNNADTTEGWKKNLLVASARLAERATGISFKSFMRAWEKEPSLRQIYEAQLRP